MEPLNARERTIATIKAFSLLLVTIFITTLAVFFVFNLPNKELQLLQNENDRLQAENKGRTEIYELSDSIVSELDRYNTELNRKKLGEGINFNLQRLDGLIGKDTSNYGKIVHGLIGACRNTLEDKMRSTNSPANNKTLTDKTKIRDGLLKELKDCNEQLSHY